MKKNQQANLMDILGMPKRSHQETEKSKSHSNAGPRSNAIMIDSEILQGSSYDRNGDAAFGTHRGERKSGDRTRAANHIKGPGLGKAKKAEKVATSPSSVSSNRSSLHDPWLDAYDTPSTSAAATPAEAAATSSKPKVKSSKITISTRAAQLRNSGFSLSEMTRKRKRMVNGIEDDISALEEHLEALEDDSILASGSVMDSSTLARMAPKRRKANVLSHEMQQAMDEQLALALDQQDDDNLDVRIASAISKSFDQGIDSGSDSDDIPLRSRSGRGRKPTISQGRGKGHGRLRDDPVSAPPRKGIKLPSRTARPTSLALKHEIIDSEASDSGSSYGTFSSMTELSELEDSDSGYSHLPLLDSRIPDKPLPLLEPEILSKSTSRRPKKSTSQRHSKSTKNRSKVGLPNPKLYNPYEVSSQDVSGINSEQDIPPGPTLPARTGFRAGPRATRVSLPIPSSKRKLTKYLDSERTPKASLAASRSQDHVGRAREGTQDYC